MEGLLALGSRQTGRRIQGHPILGSLGGLPAVLDRLEAEDRLPDMLVVATPDVSGPALASVIDLAERPSASQSAGRRGPLRWARRTPPGRWN